MQQPCKKGFMRQGMQSAFFGKPVGAHGAANRVLPELAHNPMYKWIFGAKIVFVGDEHNDIGDFIDTQPNE